MNEILKRGCFLAVLLVLLAGSLVHGQINVRSYIPFATWDDACDLRPYIQDAFDAGSAIVFTGNYNPGSPLKYPTSAGLIINENTDVQLQGDAMILRLPSFGNLLYMENGSTFRGHEWGGLHSKIDGNRQAHWDTYGADPNLGSIPMPSIWSTVAMSATLMFITVWESLLVRGAVTMS